MIQSPFQEVAVKFQKSDYDWSDHQHMSSERLARYGQVVDGIADGVLDVLLKHHTSITLLAHVLPVFSVSVRGDSRALLPVVALESSKPLDGEVLEKISTEITNSLPVSRVIYRLDKSCPEILVPP